MFTCVNISSRITCAVCGLSALLKWPALLYTCSNNSLDFALVSAEQHVGSTFIELLVKASQLCEINTM